jgi:hypothetical protein
MPRLQGNHKVSDLRDIIHALTRSYAEMKALESIKSASSADALTTLRMP